MCLGQCSDSSLHRNLAPNISCGLGTECNRDISIDCCADTWLLMSLVSVGKVRFMSYVMLLQEPACTTISEPMLWQERGDVGGSISQRWKSFVWTPAAKDARGCKRRWRA